MNYRHAYHAGNFADLIKHATQIALLDHFTRQPAPLRVIDTHAGAGAYDLSESLSQKTGEGAAGIGRLMAVAERPVLLQQLVDAVSRFNGGKAGTLYPGSPALTVARLRTGDSLIACELREDEQSSLKRTVARFAGAKVVQADGYATAAASQAEGHLLVLIDPPFEAADDYQRCAETARAVLAGHGRACVSIWLPIKDLETFDAFLRRIEGFAPAGSLVVELRLRPLTQPMKMNGCALVVLGAPDGIEADLRVACAWIAAHLGEVGARGEVYRLG